MAGTLAGGTAARLAGADRVRFAEAQAGLLLSFTQQAAAGAWISALLLRGAGLAAVTAAAGAALTAVAGSRAVPYRQPGAAGPVLRVLTASLLAGRASAEAVTGLVRRKHADVRPPSPCPAGASVGGEARQLARWLAGTGWRWCSPGPAHRAGEVRCCAGREGAGAARRCRGRFLAHV